MDSPVVHGHYHNTHHIALGLHKKQFEEVWYLQIVYVDICHPQCLKVLFVLGKARKTPFIII
jgi:hypothetical protein